MKAIIKYITICCLFFVMFMVCKCSGEAYVPDSAKYDNCNNIRITTNINDYSKKGDFKKENYTLCNINLDDTYLTNNFFYVPNFNQFEHLKGKYDYMKIIAVKEDKIYLAIHSCNYDDTSDISIISCNIYTGETEYFKDKIKNYNSSTETYALVNNNIYFTYESLQQQIHCVIDTEKKDIHILKSKQLNYNTDSFVYTYPVDENSYIESWFEINNNNLTYHVTLFNSEGNKEIITKRGDRKSDIYLYTASCGKVYEYAQINHLSESYLNIYDLFGNLLSSEYLIEVSRELNTTNGSYIEQISVFNNYFAIILGNEMPTKKCFLHNMNSLSLSVNNDILFLNSPNSINHENAKYPFISYVDSQNSSSLNLYCIDENKNVLKIAENIDPYTSFTTDYKYLYCLTNEKIVLFEL